MATFLPANPMSSTTPPQNGPSGRRPSHLPTKDSLRVPTLPSAKTFSPPHHVWLRPVPSPRTGSEEIDVSRPAIAKFDQALSLDEHDGPSKTYKKICEGFLKSPPSDSWAGEYIQTSK